MSTAVRLAPLPTIKELLNLYQVRALKKLSQNFLLDLRLTDKIVRAAGNISNGEVCEVGPGPGGITRSILNYEPSKVVLIEKDRRFQPILENLAEASYSPCHIIFGDVMHFDMSKIFSNSFKNDWLDDPPNIHLIGNLPFSVSTPLIIKWMNEIYLRSSAWSYGRVKMTLTFQEEVAERIVAAPRTKQRCRMSVICQNYCDVQHKFTIPGRAFLPKPEVNVGVVHFEPLKKSICSVNFDVIEKVVRTAFNVKNKYVIHGLKSLFPKELTERLSRELLKRAEIKEVARTCHLSNEEWMRVVSAYKFICDKNPSLYNYNYRGMKKNREEIWQEEERENEEDVRSSTDAT